jgi:hypothetical protein
MKIIKVSMYYNNQVENLHHSLIKIILKQNDERLALTNEIRKILLNKNLRINY